MEQPYTIINNDNEQASREWLLNKADTLELTLFDNSMPRFLLFGLIQVNIQMKGEIVNPETLETFKRLEPWFIRKVTNNIMYGGCPQRKKTQVDHYYFYLSDHVKQMLNEQTLFWEGSDDGTIFKGFEDPVFYQNDKMIGYMISHEYEGVICL